MSWARCRKAFCYISNKRQTGTGLAVSFFQIFGPSKKEVQVDHVKERSTNKTSPKIGGFLVRNFFIPNWAFYWSDLAFRPSRADLDNDTNTASKGRKK